jgi:hypothetical protein
MSDTPFTIQYGNGSVEIFPPTGTVFGIYKLIGYGYGHEIGTVDVTVSPDMNQESIKIRFKGESGNLRPLWMHAFNAFVEYNIGIFREALDNLFDRKLIN